LTAAFQEVAPDVKNQMLLEERRQRIDESVESYYYSVLNLCNEVDATMTEARRVRYLIRGLRPQYLENILPLDPQLVTEVLQHMRKVAEGKFLISKQETDYYAVANVKAEDSKSGEMIGGDSCILVEKTMRIVESIRDDKRQNGNKSGRCTYCHKEGHDAEVWRSCLRDTQPRPPFQRASFGINTMRPQGN